MKPPIIVGFDAEERTVTLQFADDIRQRGFTIGAQFGCARNQNTTQFCHEADDARRESEAQSFRANTALITNAELRAELEAVREALAPAHATQRGTLAEIAADAAATAISYKNANAELRADRDCWREQAEANGTLALEQAKRAEKAIADNAALRDCLEYLKDKTSCTTLQYDMIDAALRAAEGGAK